MKILETERLILRHVIESDAEFMLDLLNQPTFIKYIGDRNVRTIAEAADFIETRYKKSYADNGYGLYLVELKSEMKAVGICGFVKRAEFPNADIGFAFLPQFEGYGYAFEAAEASMNYGGKVLEFERIVAITTQDNERSGKLLGKIGFNFETLIEMSNNEVLNLYAWEK
jgi:[ribosomal protein S5]-alanine N-acetyltransferase